MGNPNINKPNATPNRPFFSSGPTQKPSTWTPEQLQNAFLGRSHRDPIAVEKIHNLYLQQKELLGIPKDYQIGIFTGSNTGAFEAALWNLLGTRPVDALVIDTFSNLWYNDARNLLASHPTTEHITVNALGEPFEKFPDLQQVNSDNDIIMVWHGTPAGVMIPHHDFIKPDRDGLVFVDATSAVFCLDLPWEKFDVVSWSWQKALGGEAGFGMLAFSPRAVEKLQDYTPPWHIPSIFHLNRKATTAKNLFQGLTLNTISMLSIADAEIVTDYARQYGLHNAIKHSWDGLKLVESWLEKNSLPFEFLIKKSDWRSPVAITIETPQNPQQAYLIAAILAQHDIAYDLKGHAGSPPCIRIWNGPTVDLDDIGKLLPWLEWAFLETTQGTK